METDLSRRPILNSPYEYPVLKARMNADMHVSEDLKNTGKGNQFVVFGEPDIEPPHEQDGRMRVKVNGVDVFHRHAFFLGANDPFSTLKTTLKAAIGQEAWATLNRDTSRAFEKPRSGRIAVKVINHLGTEVMKIFRVTR